ncbi:hypothetical protein P278_21820 [Zhouia amylolytica AD3]|uniref:Uncharacterized protein n=1 Tax=Zhouia amylolytica AD3 TaxID=1286632 RepID=W2UM22_9FLAO|nr:hypothetical protein P278_21820 [Zhouia amylolytica AD3]
MLYLWLIYAFAPGLEYLTLVFASIKNSPWDGFLQNQLEVYKKP